MRAVVLYASGYLTLENKAVVSRKRESSDPTSSDLVIQPFTDHDKKRGRVFAIHFNAIGWEEYTVKLLTTCNNLVDDRDMEAIILEAKKFSRKSRRSSARETINSSDFDPDDSMLNIPTGKPVSDDDE